MSDRPAAARLPWPHLLSYMDAALDTPPRTSLVLRQYAGAPLTLKDCEIMRQTISKIRTRIRERNASLVSPYDALVIRAQPALDGCDLHCTILPPDSAPTTVPSPQLSGLTQFQRSCPCFFTLRRPDGFTFTLGSAEEPVPSFTEGWKTIRPFLPGRLTLTNAYSLQEGTDYQIEGAAPAAPRQSLFDQEDDA